MRLEPKVVHQSRVQRGRGFGHPLPREHGAVGLAPVHIQDLWVVGCSSRCCSPAVCGHEGCKGGTAEQNGVLGFMSIRLEGFRV